MFALSFSGLVLLVDGVELRLRLVPYREEPNTGKRETFNTGTDAMHRQYE
jgi:hypothetical protein